MSDFTTAWWGYFIVAMTLGGIAWCLWLLFTQRRWLGRSSEAVTDTGHAWDGDLREMNNPVPRWWVVMYLALCVIALGYLVLYPGLGQYGGVLDYSTQSDLSRQRQRQEQVTASIQGRYADMAIPAIAADAQARQIGQRLFMNHCAQCHGSDARGSPGFPNLTDKDWLYGGAPEEILESITKGRHGVMPAWSGVIDPRTASDIADYVRSLSGLGADATRVALGRLAFSEYCVSCHGASAKGNPALGAPNLTDGIWLYGSSPRAIEETILAGRDNRMPAQEGTLTPEQIRILSAWVWAQSNATAMPGVPAR